MNSKFIFPFLIVLLLSAGCAAPTADGSVMTVTAPVVTSALLPSPASAPSETPLPPLPTLAPVEGTTSTQINVRAEPSTASNVLGIIPADTKVQILAKDPGANWLQILYPQGVDGKGWVNAQYVVIPNGTQVAVIGSDPANPNAGNVAIVQQQINVRSGPGTGFTSLGVLNAQDVVNLTGRDPNGAWLQIEFASGPDGKGWINAAFVQAKGAENVPIITEAGEVIGTGTPTGIPFTPTPTVIPAWDDRDSRTNPVANVIFEPLGTHTLIYSGDVSAPTGDAEDWIQFTPYSNVLFASLDCEGESNLQVEILENGQPVDLELACGDRMKKLNANAGSVYNVLLRAPQSSGGLQYLRYTITIQLSSQ